ncbi:MAG TPA: helix-turn-helix domain-containing protein [Trebonia sp.]|jgi:DNA-binding transcriptional ArsR family regulator
MPDNHEDSNREQPPPDAHPPPPSAGSAGQTAGTPGNPLPLTDARTMRALAHPARMAIYWHIGLDGPATATECAAVVGLSPSACSYHLRTLARYGFIEEDDSRPGDGRERRWRSKVTSISISSRTGTPAEREAARLLSASVNASAEEVRESYRNRESEYPAEWQDALGTNYDVLHVTPDELEAVKLRVIELFGEYRRLAGAERPPGARRVAVTVDLSPWFEPDA